MIPNSDTEGDPDSDPDTESLFRLAAGPTNVGGLETVAIPRSLRKQRSKFLQEGLAVIVRNLQVADLGLRIQRGLA